MTDTGLTLWTRHRQLPLAAIIGTGRETLGHRASRRGSTRFKDWIGGSTPSSAT